MEFPKTIPVETLQRTAPGYDADKLALYQALYDGGSKMDAIKAKILPVREFEMKAGGKASKHFAGRLERAPYSRSTAGFVDWLVAAALYKPPRIEVVKPIPQESADFYEKRNQNADGRGTPFACLMRDTVLEGLLHQRAYPSVNFPCAEVDEAAPETMEACFRLMRANEIDDWEIDCKGNLQWVRWHGAEMVRNEKEPWAPAKREKHLWLFFTPDNIATYVAYKDNPSGRFGWGAWEKNAAELEGVEETGGVLPVVEMRYRSGQWLMETCHDISTAIFIRDSSIEYLADKFAFQILVLTLARKQVGEIFLPDLAALHLQPGESAGFVAPQGSVLDPLFKSADKLRKDLLNSIHASAQNAASIPQAGRLSGNAVEKMREPLNVLLYSFAWPVLDAWGKALEKMVRLRGDPEGCVRITGLDDFDADEADLEEVVNGKKPGGGAGAGADEDSPDDRKESEPESGAGPSLSARDEGGGNRGAL